MQPVTAKQRWNNIKVALKTAEVLPNVAKRLDRFARLLFARHWHIITFLRAEVSATTHDDAIGADIGKVWTR